jgi:diacylglycerol kinase family enzyme
MKDALGGAAYSLMGVVTAMKMRPYQATFSSEGKSEAGLMLIMSVGNGKQCGGGFQVAPNALLDDGLLDVLVVHDIEVGKMGVIFNELLTIDNPANQYVSYVQVPSLQIESDRPLQLNLDGEPVLESRYEFNVLSRCLPFVLPADAPLAGKQ